MQSRNVGQGTPRPSAVRDFCIIFSNGPLALRMRLAMWRNGAGDWERKGEEAPGERGVMRGKGWVCPGSAGCLGQGHPCPWAGFCTPAPVLWLPLGLRLARGPWSLRLSAVSSEWVQAGVCAAARWRTPLLVPKAVWARTTWARAAAPPALRASPWAGANAFPAPGAALRRAAASPPRPWAGPHVCGDANPGAARPSSRRFRRRSPFPQTPPKPRPRAPSHPEPRPCSPSRHRFPARGPAGSGSESEGAARGGRDPN